MSDLLTQIGIQLFRIILPVTSFVGILGNLLNIVVLTRPTLYYHACSRYFVALAGNNLFYSSFILMNRLLSSGYQINLSNYSNTSCKIINYIGTLSAFLSPYLIVCASIDRYCTTSTSALLRRFSNVHTAQRMILFVVTIFSLFFIHILVFTSLVPERGFGCVVQAISLYSQVYIITQVFLFAVAPPALMMVFGLLAIRNSTHSNVVPVVVSRYNRTEYQLTRMLFFQVTVQILFTLPSSVAYLISTLPNTIRTTPIFSFTSTIFQLLFNLSYVTPFFLYLLSGRMYRKELIRVTYRLFRIGYQNQIKPGDMQNVGPHVMSWENPQTTV